MINNVLKVACPLIIFIFFMFFLTVEIEDEIWNENYVKYNEIFSKVVYKEGQIHQIKQELKACVINANNVEEGIVLSIWYGDYVKLSKKEDIIKYQEHQCNEKYEEKFKILKKEEETLLKIEQDAGNELRKRVTSRDIILRILEQ